MELSVIIPAYNEEKRLGNSLNLISQYLEKRYNAYEVIVVDDGSSDGTRHITEKLKKSIPNLKIVSNPKNMGKGYSVKKGILRSAGDTILFSDADLSTPIDQLEKCENSLKGGYDIAIGSRISKGAVILKHQSILREYMGKIFNLFVYMIVIGGIKDTQCGFKLFKRRVALDIFSRQKINGFSFDVEILYIAKKLGYKIGVVPVIWSNVPNSKVRILGSSLNMLLELAKIKHLHSDL